MIHLFTQVPTTHPLFPVSLSLIHLYIHPLIQSPSHPSPHPLTLTHPDSSIHLFPQSLIHSAQSSILYPLALSPIHSGMYPLITYPHPLSYNATSTGVIHPLTFTHIRLHPFIHPFSDSLTQLNGITHSDRYPPTPTYSSTHLPENPLTHSVM